MNENLIVTISYLKNGEMTWKEISILPEDYFWKDPNDDLDNQFSWDSVPIHDYAVGYLNMEVSDVSKTILSIYDERQSVSRKVIASYWNRGANWIAERIDVGTDWRDEEIIINILLTINPQEKFLILRFNRNDELLNPVLQSFITQNNDGSQTDEVVL